MTIIPTSAVSVNDEQYVNYMSVKSWDTPGTWTTNYSPISMYDQATDTWVLVPSTIRSAGWLRSSTPYVAGSQNFQQAAYVLEPEDKVEEGEPATSMRSAPRPVARDRPTFPGWHRSGPRVPRRPSLVSSATTPVVGSRRLTSITSIASTGVSVLVNVADSVTAEELDAQSSPAQHTVRCDRP